MTKKSFLARNCQYLRKKQSVSSQETVSFHAGTVNDIRNNGNEGFWKRFKLSNYV